MSIKTTVSSLKNPVIPLRGVCDPHMHVFNGRVWLYATHDAMPGSNYFVTKDWQIWSSPDCVTWTHESTVRPEDFWMGSSNRCWAVDCAERNGRYYFYYSDGSSRTGVAVADSPEGPFSDPLGKPLLDGTLTPTREYDPALFRDDDGEYYIVFGGPAWAYGEGCGYFIARLNEDMISLAEKPRRLELDHIGDDKASLNKWNGKYYLSYGGFYAVSDSVYGPYRFVGHTGSSIDHTSFFEWNGQLFQAVTIVDYHGEYRSSGICYVHIREDGSLATDQLIVEYGVGKYDGNWNRIEAEWFMCSENARKVENKVLSGFSAALSEDGYLVYPHIRNLSDKVGMYISGWCLGKGGSIDIREGNREGRLLGTVSVPARNEDINWHNRWKQSVDFDIKLSDETDICLSVHPEKDSEILIDFFHFYPEPIVNP